MNEVPLDFDTPEYQLAIGLIERTNQSFFLTGKAGTGKSTFLRHIINTVKKDILVLAPTGIAAINIGGVTIHSFFEFPLRQMLPEEPGIKTFWRESEKRKIISSLETVIIDEVSMVRADLIDAIDCSLRRNGGNPNLPFGGKQVLFVGDLFQLEPILPAQGNELSYKQIYGNGHFYNARVFTNMAFPVLALTRPHRQQDEEFISLLDKVRMNEVSAEDICRLNIRVSKLHSPLDYVLTLTTRADAAEGINKAHVNDLSSTAITYNAQVSGTFESARFPTDDKLILKKSAQIIFIRNDSERRWVNGTIGKVEDLTGESVLVRLSDDRLVTVDRVTWEQIRYEFDESRGRVNGKVIGKFIQYPLKLAWAITIHKSQGMSLDQAIIDFGSGAFAGGQAYVALSRVRTMDGLFLNQPIKQTDIIVDESLKAFVRSLPAATTALLKDGVHSINSKNSGKIAGYYFRTAFEKLPLAGEMVALDNLRKAFAHLTSDLDLSFADSSIGGNNGLDEESINSSLLKDIILFYAGNPEQSLKSFLECEVQTEFTYFFISKCYSALKDYDNALKYIELSLEQVRSSRNLYQKATVLKSSITDSNRQQYVECLSDALLADPYSATVYTDVLAAMKADNFTADLPSVYEYEQQVNAIDLQQNFFKSIIRTVNRYRKKILNISARSGSAVELPSNILDSWNAKKASTGSNSNEDLEDFLEGHKEDLESDWLLD